MEFWLMFTDLVQTSWAGSIEMIWEPVLKLAWSFVDSDTYLSIEGLKNCDGTRLCEVKEYAPRGWDGLFWHMDLAGNMHGTDIAPPGANEWVKKPPKFW